MIIGMNHWCLAICNFFLLRQVSKKKREREREREREKEKIKERKRKGAGRVS
jgi:uncharacterized protein YutD